MTLVIAPGNLCLLRLLEKDKVKPINSGTMQTIRTGGSLPEL